MLKVECDDQGIKSIGVESWAKWVLGIVAALMVVGIGASVAFTIKSSAESAAMAARMDSMVSRLDEKTLYITANSARINAMEASISTMRSVVDKTATDVEWIKRQWERELTESRK